MPTCAATASAVRRLSPVIIQTSRPSCCSRATASAEPVFRVSATPSDAYRLLIHRHQHRRLAGGRQFALDYGQACCALVRDTSTGQELARTNKHVVTVHVRGNAAARNRLERLQ